MATILDLAHMSQAIYAKNPRNRDDPEVQPGALSGNYSLLSEPQTFVEHHSGFEGGIFECGDTWVVCFRGTSPADKRDIGADVRLGMKLIPEQFFPAMALFERARLTHGTNVVITGHSLGGGLAQLVSAASTYPAVTFNAPGVKAVAETLSGSTPFGFHAANCMNIVLKNDPVSSFGTLIGKKLRLPNPDSYFFLNPLKYLEAHKQSSVIKAVRYSKYHSLTPDQLMRA